MWKKIFFGCISKFKYFIHLNILKKKGRVIISNENAEKLSGEELAEQRYAKFRAIGRYVEGSEENGAEG